jgi:ABC-type uncharacterized transport system auxiliary subunit
LASVLAILSLAVALSGCGLSRPYPQIRSFALEALTDLADRNAAALNEPARHGAARSAGVARTERRLALQVLPGGAAAAYETRKLVYRIGPSELAEDFYNEFAGQPARMIADETARWLERTNPQFEAARTVGPRGADLALEVFVSAFHADFSVRPPQAEAEIRFSLSDLRGRPKTLWAQTYRGRRPLPEESADRPADQVRGLGLTLGDVLTALDADLRAVLGRPK